VLQQMRAKAAYIWIVIAAAFIGGFLFVETSGLLGLGPVTANTVVATVNGRDVSYLTWVNASNSLAQQQEQASGRGLTLDERQQIEEQAFNQLIGEILLEQEYRRRGIRVTDQEVIDMARAVPPPQFQEMPELQTEGRFDPEKYRRFVGSPVNAGLRQQLEQYYRAEIPRQKLFGQLAGDAYVSDTRLWQVWRDTHDSATVSFVAFRPTLSSELTGSVSDADVARYYEAHRGEFDRPGVATISILTISRRPTAADSEDTRRQMESLRAEIARGAKFEDVAKRESDDTVTGAKGGDLGKSVRGTFVKSFDDAAFRLPVGVISQPVKTEYGWHLIRVDRRVADSIWVHHILKFVKQSDTAATRTDRLADSLSRFAAGATEPARFDSAAKLFRLLQSRITVREGEPASYLGRTVPSVSAWAFSGVRVGETSDLYDDEVGYYLARLDSLRPGGVQPVEVVREEIRSRLATERALDALAPKADSFARGAARTSLEVEARSQGLTVSKEGPFARTTTVPSLGFASQAIGAAFTLPLAAVSEPVRTDDALFVLRVDRRVSADSAKWAEQKSVQRLQVLNTLREQRVRMFLENLRKAANVEDRRKEVLAVQRRQSGD
jgi:peptidyl-prolyl cis-trans isomerase D